MMLVTGALLTAASVATAQVKPAARRPFRRGAAAQPAAFVNGQIILYCKPGTAMADVNRLAASVGATQTDVLLLDDCYHLTLDGAHQDQGSTANAVAQLALDPVVRSVRPPIAFQPQQTNSTSTQEPNDPFYKNGSQHGLAQINMPRAWALQKGAPGVTVAIIDSGFDPQHEDKPTFSKDSYDYADNDSDITADGVGGEPTHGVGVSGIMLANTNNNVGIAGVIWQNVQCLAYKIQKKGQANLDEPGILNSYAAIHKLKTTNNTDNIVALNMSYGGPYNLGPTDPEYVALQQLNNDGVNLVAAAGNDTSNEFFSPADFPFVISVSAVNRASQLTYFSNFGKIEIASPGGEQFSETDQNGILSLDLGNKYAFTQGTSDAAPFVTAVLGLLRSVPGVTAAIARDALLTEANHTITHQTSIPDNRYGYGLLDAYASLSKVSNVIEITQPVGIDPTTGLSTAGGATSSTSGQAPAPIETLRPRVGLHLTNVAVVGGVPQFSVSVNNTSTGKTLALINNGVINPQATDQYGVVVTDLNVINNSVGGFAQYDITFRYRATDAPTSQQQVLVATSTPSNTSLPSLSSTVQFNITPHSFNSGLNLVSFPIAETAADNPAPGSTAPRSVFDILATPNVTLYRYYVTASPSATSAAAGNYATYGILNPKTAAQDPAQLLASLHPSDTATGVSIVTTPTPAISPLDPATSANTITDATPVGLGYFMNLPSGAAVRTYGRDFPQQTIRVPLHEGWNMIGDPFTFQVAFAGTSFETANGTRYTAPDAATNNVILPFLYRFVGGEYTFDALPNGTLNPWEGNWIYVVPANANAVNASTNVLTMVVPPTSTGVVADNTRGVRGQYGRVAAQPTRAAHVVTSNAMPAVRGAGAWALRLQASANNMTDTHNYIGVSSDASVKNPYSRAPKPPRVGSNVMLGLQQSGTNAVYAQDLRPMGGTQTWDVVVSTDQPAADVSVAWPDAHTLPRNVRLTLTDKVTGQTVDMRSRSAYRFNGGGATSRALTITAQPGDTRERIQFNSVVVTPHTGGRGAGAGSVYQIEYELSGAAEMEVSILNTGGRVVTQVEQGHSASAGVNRSVWNGRDSQNRTLATGTYIVKMVARSAEGKVTQYHYPLTITR